MKQTHQKLKQISFMRIYIMSLNRLIYDSCSYKSELNESVSYLSHVLERGRFEHCQKCRPELGIVGGTAVSHPQGNLVDLESSLYGIDRPATHCPSYKWLPTDGKSVQGKEYIKPVCHPQIQTDPMLHLNSCQFYNYPEVPRAPDLDLFKCARK
jgi:hypothetical protein